MLASARDPSTTPLRVAVPLPVPGRTTKAPTRNLKQSRHQLAKCIGPVAHRMLRVRLHLAEGLLMPCRHEDRIVAEAVLAARRPDEGAVDAAFEPFAMAVGPAQGEGADEMGVAA